MSEAPVRTEAREHRGPWPGFVWLLPAAALLLVAVLAARAYLHRGVDVVVTFPNSGGAQVGDTKVIFQGVEAGRVTKIAIAKDHSRVDMTLRLSYRAKPYLRTGTVFWLVGAKPSLTDVASLKAALAGVTIGVATGPGAPTRRFVGLDRPPAVPPGTPGRAFTLTAEKIESVRVSSSLFYRGAEAGKITSIDLDGLRGFTVGVFLNAPFDKLVRADTLFWIASPLEVSLTGDGLRTQLAPANAALAGGVEMNTTRRAEAEPASAAGSRFVLHASRGEAIASGTGPQVTYTLRFSAPVGDLEEGAPVRLRGRQIGAVRAVGFSLSADGRVLDEPVTIVVRPDRLNLTGASAGDAGERNATDRALAGLVSRGFRAKLAQTPPLLGPRSIILDRVKGVRPAALVHDGQEVSIPTVASADVADLTDKAGAILDKVNAIPLQQIGANIRSITSRLNSLLGSPKVSDSLTHLDSTLQQVDAMVKEVRPKVGPLVSKLDTVADELNRTAVAARGVISGEGQPQDANLPDAIRELTDAARSVRALSDYLGRHPEAVLRGKRGDSR